MLEYKLRSTNTDTTQHDDATLSISKIVQHGHIGDTLYIYVCMYVVCVNYFY